MSLKQLGSQDNHSDRRNEYLKRSETAMKRTISIRSTYLTLTFVLVISCRIISSTLQTDYKQSWATQLKKVFNSIQFIEKKVQFNSTQLVDL
ncbi:unnamed protein product [Rotaria magnacalcarata]